MTDDIYRPRKSQPAEDGDDPLASIRKIQQQASQETGREQSAPLAQPDAPFAVSGNVPPAFREAMARARGQVPPQQTDDAMEVEDEAVAPVKTPATVRSTPRPNASKVRVTGSDQFEEAMKRLGAVHQWEEFEFPSKGKFYTDIPSVIHIRPMTGEEEQILATPRFVKKGTAIDMIFQRCIQENIPTDKLLSVDRTHLLIYLRGISYTPEYDVEIKCPDCGTKFQTVIDLNSLDVQECPSDYGPEALEGVLPVSGFHYRYRLSLGRDEQQISQHRDKKIQDWGDQTEDDTLLYRTALLLEEIEGVTMMKEIQYLLKKLPIADVAHLRNEINQPPFGVKTEVPMLCPLCTEGFKIDLPLETSFFFPRKKEEKAQV